MTPKQLSQSLKVTGIFLAILWAVYLLDWLVPGQFAEWGVVPRRLQGLVGIPLLPFIHVGLSHLISNTIPLAILLFLFAASRKTPWLRVAEIALLSGLLLWALGRNGTVEEGQVHVGASGLIYGLIAYLIVVGIREKHPVSLSIAVLVGFLYGGTLFWGVLPSDQPVSWDGHLTGAIAGGILAALVPKQTSETDNESPVDLLRRHGFEVE